MRFSSLTRALQRQCKPALHDLFQFQGTELSMPVELCVSVPTWECPVAASSSVASPVQLVEYLSLRNTVIKPAQKYFKEIHASDRQIPEEVFFLFRGRKRFQLWLHLSLGTQAGRC